VRVLFDECLPRRLKRELVGHDAQTTPEMGWASKRNGELLRLAEREFDVFLTVDRKLQQQQNLSAFNIAVVVLVAHSNTLADLQPLMARVLESSERKKGRSADHQRSRRKSTDK
jgi:predicted nuclease of predicted toxin-antitoxin system